MQQEPVATLDVTIKGGGEFEVEEAGISSHDELRDLMIDQVRLGAWILLGGVLFNKFEIQAIEILSVDMRDKEEV